MVNVLIIGATGYIGQALTQSLVRSGNHRVYGLARTIAKGQALIREEVIPVLGSISESTKLLRAIDEFHINVVVDVAGAGQESKIVLELLKGIGQNRASAAAAKGIQHYPKLGFIYTSGTWVHGSSNNPVNDLTPVGVSDAPTPPAELVTWRAKLENDILDASDVLDVMIVRPALVYGRSSGFWSSLLQPIYSAAQSGASSATVAIEPDSQVWYISTMSARDYSALSRNSH
jgi:nucleoside-diphosphate-sugar epimerase